MKSFFTTLNFLLLSIILLNGCIKKPQYTTTLAVTGFEFTASQLDTTAVVLKRRLLLEEFKNVAVIPDYKTGEIKIKSAQIDLEWINNYLLSKGNLVFYECYSMSDLIQSFNEADKKIAGSNFVNGNSGPLWGIFENILQPYRSASGEEQWPAAIGTVAIEKIATMKKYLANTADLFPADVLFFFKDVKQDKSKKKFFEVYCLKNNDSKFIAGNHIIKASVNTDNKYNSVAVTFDGYGSHRFERLTQKNTGKPIAILLDEKVVSAPFVNGPITGGKIEIAGVFTKQEALQYVSMFQSGYLPLKLTVKSMEQVKEK